MAAVLCGQVPVVDIAACLSVCLSVCMVDQTPITLSSRNCFSPSSS